MLRPLNSACQDVQEATRNCHLVAEILPCRDESGLLIVRRISHRGGRVLPTSRGI